MARVIWTEPALLDLDEVAEYIALDNPGGASRFVERGFEEVERLEDHPNSGRHPPELSGTSYREIIVVPCRIFYRMAGEVVYIVHVIRSEQELRAYRMEQRKRGK